MNTILHSNGAISEEQTAQKKDSLSLAVKRHGIKLFWLDAEQKKSTAMPLMRLATRLQMP